MSYLKINNLHKRFVTPGGRVVDAVRDVSLELDRGGILCVVGHNGSGKTTLLNCIRQMFLWDSGDILVNGTSITKQKINVVSVFQEVGVGVVGSMTAIENLSLVYSRERGFLNSFPKRKYNEAIHEFLMHTSLKERFDAFANTPVSELSGGQRQQVAIMMAVMRNPQILLLDEFVANLDDTIMDEILSWIRQWILEHQVTTIMVTHDRELARDWGHYVLEMCDGGVASLEKMPISKEVAYG